MEDFNTYLKNKHFLHMVRMGTFAEKEILEQTSESYDVLVFNANLIEQGSAATASFISKIKKGYIIDPIPYVFTLHIAHLQSEQIDRKTKEKSYTIKKPYEKLATKYSNIIYNLITTQKRKLLITDFENPEERLNMSQTILEYQLHRLNEELEEDAKYGIVENVSPLAVLAPYFYIPFNSNEWLKVNTSFIEETKQLIQKSAIKKPLFGVIFISQYYLDYKEQLLSLANKFLNTQCDGYMFWFDSFDEYNISPTRLDNYKQFIKLFNEQGKPLFNMYGSHLSILASKIGMKGYAHGALYWENKPFRPLSVKGIPKAKYYLPAIHQRISSKEAYLSVLANMGVQEFHRTICGCNVCNNVITKNVGEDFLNSFGETDLGKDGREYSTGKAHSLCKKHYILVLRKEIKDTLGRTNGEISTELESALNKYSKTIDSIDLTYLRTWQEILN